MGNGNQSKKKRVLFEWPLTMNLEESLFRFAFNTSDVIKNEQARMKTMAQMTALIFNHFIFFLSSSVKQKKVH